MDFCLCDTARIEYKKTKVKSSQRLQENYQLSSNEIKRIDPDGIITKEHQSTVEQHHYHPPRSKSTSIKYRKNDSSQRLPATKLSKKKKTVSSAPSKSIKMRTKRVKEGENFTNTATSNVPAAYLDEICSFIASKLFTLSNILSSKSNLSVNRHHLVRHSLSLYAASGVILALCYLTTTTSAASLDVPHEIFAEGKSDKEILDHLLTTNRYDKRLLPPVDDMEFCCGLQSPEMGINMPPQFSGGQPGRPQNRGTLTINVNVLLLSLASPDESSLKYEVEFLLNQQWHDPRLRYANQSKYEFLNAIHHYQDVWLPDTYFIMHGDFKDPLNPQHFALRIYRNGTIQYAMRRHLILSCQGNLNIFPFDDPLCSFAMESISYELSALRYVWRNDEGTLMKSPSLTTLNAYLIKNATHTCPQKGSWRGNYSCLKVELIFTRDRAFYFTTVFIPGIILVTSSFITFWLEWNAVPARSMIGNYSCLEVNLTFTRDRAFYFTTVFIPGIILVTSSFITFWLEWNAVPARVMIGVTTMLNFFTTSNGFRSTLPVVSNLTAMNVWDGVCMCFIYASLLEFVCVNYVGRKRPLHNVVYRPGENPVTQRLPAVLSRIGIILASPLNTIEREFVAAMSSEKSNQASTKAPANHPASAAIKGASEVTVTALTATTSSLTYSVAPPRTSTSGVMLRSSGTSSAPTMVLKSTGAVLKELNFPEDSSDVERGEGQCPSRPPRLRISRSTSTKKRRDTSPRSASSSSRGNSPTRTCTRKLIEETPAGTNLKILDGSGGEKTDGEKKRDPGGPNEIVACTHCGGGNSPCTHSANNGCATETCFVQVRKKEPPHPIRVAKTIDVIARITFPTAYSIFLIFFFIHYKGFS